MADAQTNGASPSSPAPPSQAAHRSTARLPTPPSEAPTTTAADPTVPAAVPASSLNDSGLGRRPRDARLIHMLLAGLGVTAYQERVPLQLLDFAYRHAASVLQDALHLTSEHGAGAGGGGGGGVGRAANPDAQAISLQGLRLAVASRTHYQLGGHGVPKEQLLETAQERNRVALPPVARDGGMRLPPEKYVLSGVGFGLREEWESEGEEEVPAEAADLAMEEPGEGAGDDGDERMEDIFGEEFGAEGGDKEMEEE